MRKILLISAVFFITVSAGFAQQKSLAGIRIRAAGLGRILITRNKLNSTVNLGEGLEGCVYLTKSQKAGLDRRGCAASPPDFKLIDAVIENNRIFLLVSADAAGNCNVCGECGATDAYTLFWLSLDSRLRLQEKQQAGVESCLSRISMLSPAENEESDERGEEFAGFKFKGNVLTIEYEKTIRDENDVTIYEFSHLEYNRKTPQKGFIIKTEKRDKSSAKKEN